MPLDPATEILIAELHRRGLLDGEALLSMARRFEAIGDGNAAHSVRMIPLSNALDSPEARREGMHIVTAVTGPD